MLVAIWLAVIEDFRFDVTDRAVAVGGITALGTFLTLAITSTIKRYRY